MDPIKLRLSTWKDGAELTTFWTFTPLSMPRAYVQARESTADGSGRARRRPLNIADALQLKIPAGLLLDDSNFRQFLRLLMAHKIELQQSVAGQLVWNEYDLDVSGALPDPSHPENVDRLRSYTLKLVQSEPVWYDTFEDVIDNFING
jgi:hypothetical protein